MNIYLDIDGVLLHDGLDNQGQLVDGAIELIRHVTSKHDCYWLTTHCRGGENRTIEYLSPRLPKDVLELVYKIKLTDWGTWKTDAINFNEDFRWLDDDVYQAEYQMLDKHNARSKLILVDLHSNPNQLKEIIKTL